ncbi:MAG: serine/threonine protein kinase [Deltaproteobacteria bacterium]|nr:serine/threonine protein kinase [Deltaproteobacteria bacterium]
MSGVDEVEPSSPEGAMQPLAPRWVGEYDVLASLGKGGAGEVFLALKRGPHDFRKLVVLKLLHAHFEDDEEVVEMFLDEARLAGRLDHPNIAQTLEVGVSGDRHYMVMGYLEGIGLDRLLATLGQRHERLAPELAAFIAGEVLAGLHYAHELKDHDGSPLEVVHRDVSPSNVFLCWDGTVKLIDFGIAKAAIRRANTDSGVIKGKWGYVAPEHATGDGTDRRADVWSTGVVLWESLTGKRLFPNLNDVTTLQALVAGDLQPLEEHAPDAPEALAAVVHRALQHDPDHRYASAQVMADDIRDFFADRPQPVRREDLADLLGDLFEGERERQQVLLAELVDGALAVSRTGSFGVSRAQAPIPEPPERREPAPPPGWRMPLMLAAAAVATLTAIMVGGVLTDEEAGMATSEPAAESGGAQGLARSHGATEGDEGASGSASESESESASESASESESESEVGDRPSAVGDRPSAVGDRPSESAVGDRPSESAVGDRPSESAVGDRPSESAVGDRPSESAVGDRPSESESATEEPDEAEEAAEAPGLLSLDTIPWSEVRLGDQVLGVTPLRNVELPPGDHELTFVNTEAGIRRSYTVRMVSGESTRRRVPLR